MPTSQIRKRGIPEVPMDVTSQEEMRQFLRDMRQTVIDLRGPTATPSPASNLKATALPLAVLIQWTRGINADGTHLVWNTSPTLQGGVIVDAGKGNQYVDYVGVAGVKRYYWVCSYDNHAPVMAKEVGPVSATTLASTGVATLPAPPSPGQALVTDTLTGHVVDRYSPHYK